MWKCVHKNIFKFLLFENVVLSIHKSIWVETLIVDTDLLQLFFIEIKLNVFSVLESLVADRTTGIFNQPSVNAVFVVNMKAAQHSTGTIVFYAFEANNTILYEIFACLHSNKSNLYILIHLFQKVVSDCESSSLNIKFINIVSLPNTINSLIELDLAPVLVLG